jgi:hypothetical protein
MRSPVVHTNSEPSTQPDSSQRKQCTCSDHELSKGDCGKRDDLPDNGVEEYLVQLMDGWTRRGFWGKEGTRLVGSAPCLWQGGREERTWRSGGAWQLSNLKPPRGYEDHKRHGNIGGFESYFYPEPETRLTQGEKFLEETVPVGRPGWAAVVPHSARHSRPDMDVAGPPREKGTGAKTWTARMHCSAAGCQGGACRQAVWAASAASPSTVQ